MKNYENLNPTKEEITTLIESAEGRIKSAKVLLKEQQYRDAISRSYYAFLDAAKALLLTKGKTAKTHEGVLSLFGLEFGKSGEVPKELFRFYKRVKKDREEADYEFLRKFSKSETEEAIKMAEKFVSFIGKKIET
ncbi:HEPN domain-containing protein [Patescibacteria group bacterium]|nr:HEPN domain-containing protein [Patescibacteria group bacterium]